MLEAMAFREVDQHQHHHQHQHQQMELNNLLNGGNISWLDADNFAINRMSTDSPPMMRTPKRSRLDNATKQKNQRYAANQRERKRMRSINKAFEVLKKHVPIPSGSDESKLSKGDTLRFAIHYIRRLQEMIVQDNLARARSARQKHRAEVRSGLNDSGAHSQFDGTTSISSNDTVASDSFDEDTLSTELFRREVKIIMRLPEDIERELLEAGASEAPIGHMLGWRRKERPAEKTDKKTVKANTWWPSMVLCCDGPNVTTPQFYCCRHFHQHVRGKRPDSDDQHTS